MTRRSKSHRRKRVSRKRVSPLRAQRSALSRKRVSRKRVSRKRVSRKMKRKRHISYSVNKDLQDEINHFDTMRLAEAKRVLANEETQKAIQELDEARSETQKAIQELNDFYRENQESCFQAILRELKRK